MVRKTIRFDYFKPCLEEDIETDYYLTTHLNALNSINFEHRIMPYAGNTIRLGTLIYHANYQPETTSPFPFPLWQMTYTRIRPDVPGTTTKTTAEITPLDLEDDEYIAEDTTALYDPELNYLVIQRNRTGTPPSAMKQFFNRMNQADNEPNIEFQIMAKDNPAERALKHNFHKSIHLRFKNVRNEGLNTIVDDNATLNGIIQSARTLTTDQEYPVQAELILSIPGRRPDASLNHRTHKAIINLANKLISNDIVDKLWVRGKIDEESSPEEVDLINDAIREWLHFEVANNKFIAYSTIFEKLAIAYANRRPTLLST